MLPFLIHTSTSLRRSFNKSSSPMDVTSLCKIVVRKFIQLELEDAILSVVFPPSKQQLISSQ